jgi:hypothetical protein
VKAIVILMFAVVLLAFGASAADPTPPREQIASPGAGSPARFVYHDIFIDPGGKLLAAYQFELLANSKVAKIVGVEGGEHAAFKQAPYYDPAALSKNRIIIAAFNTGADLPAARTRVARLHLRVTDTNGVAPQRFQIQLQSAADAAGAVIDAVITSQEGPKP